jgi:hypothetical protein
MADWAGTGGKTILGELGRQVCAGITVVSIVCMFDITPFDHLGW